MFDNMKRELFDIDTIAAADLLDTPALLDAYKQYLMNSLHFDRQYADMASDDMRNPYTTPYVEARYEGTVCVDGESYTVDSCFPNLVYCDIPGADQAPPFEFLMLIKNSDIPNSTVDEYIAAEKRYIIL